MYKYTRCILNIILLLLFNFVLLSNAFADECQKLEQIPAWNEGMSALNVQMTQKNWDEALKTTEKLNNICDRSPILNYAMGRIYKELGNDSKALYYMQRATLYTEEFAVKGKTLELMWFDRYEAEHPEARPEVIEKRQTELNDTKKQVDELTKEIIALKGDVKSASLDSKLKTLEDYEAERNHYAAGLWTGVGIAAAGLALTVTGGVLAFNYKDKHKVDLSIDDNNNVKADLGTQGALYWGLFGAGLAMTITGFIFTGIFGYHYTHTSENFTFNITPNSAELSFNF